MFETFVKEKTTLLGYVHDLIKFAAKSQNIDVGPQSKILVETVQEETKVEDELRIKDTRECCIIAARVNAVVSSDQPKEFMSISLIA